jgi:hypothetical protein
LICPWASRTLIARKLKKLDDVISVSVVEPILSDQGWRFGDYPGSNRDEVNGATYLHEIYTRADPMGGEEGQRPGEEGAGALLLLVGQDLGVGEAGSIVDADMDEVPADALVPAAAVAGDTVADAVDPAELLGIDVDEFTRGRALIADHRRLRLEG